MDNNTYVYCTKCVYCNFEELNKTGNTECAYKDKCNNWNPEDSRPYSERPFYKEIKPLPWLYMDLEELIDYDWGEDNEVD